MIWHQQPFYINNARSQPDLALIMIQQQILIASYHITARSYHDLVAAANIYLVKPDHSLISI